MRLKTKITNFLLIVILVSCSGTSRRGSSVSMGEPVVIKPSAAVNEGEASQMEMRVLFTSPRGAVSGQPEISASFSLPMKELVKAEDSPLLDGKAPLEIEPPIEGEFKWLGSRTVMFAPAKPIPQATFFKVKVPSGLRSISGRVLGEPYTWEFETPPPRVVDSDPGQGYVWARKNQEIKLYFNQRIDPAILKAHTRIFVSNDKLDKKGIDFDASRIGKYEGPGYQGSAVTLKPKQDLPLDSLVMVIIDKDLTGEEGPRPMGSSWETSFRTYGPFRVIEYRCGWSYSQSQVLDTEATCDPESSISLLLSNQVPTKGIEKLVSVTPALKNMTVSKYDKKTNTINVHGSWKAGARYKIALQPSMKDEFGQPLKGTKNFALETLDYYPSWEAKFDGDVIESSQNMKLPVSVLNIEGLDVHLLHVTDQREIVSFNNYVKDDSTGEFLQRLSGDSRTKKFPLDFPKKSNVSTLGIVDLEKAAKEGTRNGLYILHIKDNSNINNYNWFLRVTGIGITSKASADKLLVWATSLKDGKPVADAQVTARDSFGKELWTGKTGGGGVAVIPGKALWEDYYRDQYGKEFCPYIFVSKGEDFNYIDHCGMDSISPWQFSAPYDHFAGRKKLLGTIVTDRGVYRPGEKVRMKGYLRYLEGGKLKIPKGESFDIRITDSRGVEVMTQEVVSTSYGSFSYVYPVSTAAPTGYYYIDLRGEDEDMRLSKSFGVEEYRAPNFKVNVRPDKKSYIRGEEAKFAVSGEYLFGGVMSESPVDWFYSCWRDWFYADDFEDYSFEDQSSWWKEGIEYPSGSDSGHLTGTGELKAAVKMDFNNDSWPLGCQVEATVESPDRQRVAGRDSFTVHPAQFYAGIAVDERILAKGDTLTARIIALGSDDKKPVSGKKIEVTLLRRIWQMVESEGLYDDYYADYEPLDKKMGSCSVVSSKEAQLCKFKLSKGGEYIIRAEGKDGKGNRTISTYGVWASGWAEDISWWQSRDVGMKMESDKDLYKAGETARILVQTPFPESEALITVEREGILSHFTRHFDSRAPMIEIPITEGMRPNVYVSVAAIRGRAKAPPKLGGDDPGKPAVKVGYMTLKVEIEGKRLKLDLKADKGEYKPGGKVNVDIDVRGSDGKGRRSEVAVFVVDEAVLMLTGFTLPDLTSLFYGNRALGVSNSDCRMSILQRRKFGTEKGKSGGGGGEEGEGMEGEAVRKLFETTIFYDPEVKTGDDGKAKVSFKLPDNLTTFRVMALAQTEDDSFGDGKTSFRVNKPLLLKISLPRFARTDDSFEGGVVVHNYSAGESEVVVKASAEGIQIAGNDTKKIVIPAGGAAEVRFPFSAKRAGEAVLRFSVSQVSGKEKDALEVKLPVRAPSVTEVVATYGSTKGGVLEGIGEIEGVRDDVGGVDLRLASTAFVGLDESIESLVEYPYGCSEQLTSRLIPMVALDEIIKEYDMEVNIDRKRLVETVAKLQKMQSYGGGWGYFTEDPCPYPWLSAYVTWGLYQAQKRGFSVDDTVLDKGAEFLKTVLRDGYWCSYLPPWWQEISLPTKAFIVYVLADMGRADDSYHAYLYEQRKELPLLGKILLAEAIYLKASGGKSGQLKKIGKDDRNRVEELLRDALNNIKQTPSSAHLTENLGDDFVYIMYSDKRNTAMALSALLRIDPEHFLVQKMVKWILESRGKDGTWGTTQENAYALMALSDYWKEMESEKPNFVARVLMGDSELFSSIFKGRDMKAETKHVSMKELMKSLPSKILFSKEGDGTLYYAAALEYVPTDLPKEPIDRGIFVEREYYTLDDYSKGAGGKPALLKTISSVKGGTNLVVRLTVVTTGQRNFVVLEDPLPAGLEVMNTNFATTSYQDVSELQKGTAASGQYPGYWWWSNPFYHSEVYDDRFVTFADEVQPGIYHYAYLARATTKGKFVAPPTKVQEMYQPEVFGRTGYLIFEVQ